VGKYRKIFVVYKFRTMVHGASLKPLTEANDDRVTRIGKWLRKSHLDELPQLVNIVRGEMVFVGPRPASLLVDARNRKKFKKYPERDQLLPGLTGLRQLYPRKQATRHFALDLILINNVHRCRFRVWIICWTIAHVCLLKGI